MQSTLETAQQQTELAFCAVNARPDIVSGKCVGWLLNFYREIENLAQQVVHPLRGTSRYSEIRVRSTILCGGDVSTGFRSNFDDWFGGCAQDVWLKEVTAQRDFVRVVPIGINGKPGLFS